MQNKRKRIRYVKVGVTLRTTCISVPGKSYSDINEERSFVFRPFWYELASLLANHPHVDA
jgi:hypothetical protein